MDRKGERREERERNGGESYGRKREGVRGMGIEHDTPILSKLYSLEDGYFHSEKSLYLLS